MKDVESDMAALELDIDAAFAPKVEIGGGNSSSSEEASSSSERMPLAPPPLNAIDDDDDITSQLLSMLAEEMSQKKRKRNLKTAGPSTTGIRHRKALALASPADELKREKNRDSVKRSYYRKIETLGELRAHTEYLREQYNRLLAQWEDKTEREKAETAKDPSSLMKRYLELSRLRDRLWMENTQLHEQFEDREKISFRFQRLFDVNYQLMDHSIAAPIEEENKERRVQTPMLIMDEMSFESFNKFAQDAQRTFEGFVASRHRMITTDTALGWTCSHVAKDNSFGYYFEKSFRRSTYVSASDVARTAWQTLTSPERHSKLYAPALHTRFHIMQQFDSNSYVLYRTMEKEGEDSITTALIVMTRIPHPNDSGCLIICKGLRREEHTLHVEFSEAVALQKKKEWRQSMYWINIEEVPVDDNNNSEEMCGEDVENKLKVVHGGIMNNMGDRSRSFWLFENLQIALRWEQNLGLGEPLS
ncbi:Gamma-secretase subunit PEN-2 [Phytophthora cinnamomi]|uniref:Gamma-secretase subunit PEN-2 n=1 Tax=Phytophthora cinnamomi TaxID=4785 RepID=UPI00355AA4AE|nr:Gamma-secretase subunit PEN-2 [Phytophthora cinnamomi]